MKYSRQKLISLYLALEEKLGSQPTRKQWEEDLTTPSDMPLRTNFVCWTDFVIACGRKPHKPYLSRLARENSVRARKGKKGGNNKGGRITDRHGYVLIWKPDHPNCKHAGYVHEHRLVMSDHLDRPLIKGENIHHINGVRDDNRIDNLEIWTTTQPSGQRLEDKIAWAITFLKDYGYIVHENPELLEAKP